MVAKDVGTTVTGIQGAITAYALVMAALMITGAKVGALIGRKRAFALESVVYGCGSFTTSIGASVLHGPASPENPAAVGRRPNTRCRGTMTADSPPPSSRGTDRCRSLAFAS
jgi:MFS family permease